MERPIRSIFIVGGGTAGWLTAAIIAARHASGSGRGLEITLVESETIGIVGVGEGTWPTMRSTLKKVGISETDFFRECNASFKHGAKFARWVTGQASDFYYHPLMLPEGFPSFDLAPYWMKYSEGQRDAPSFSNAVCFQEAVCELGLAPKLITTPEYAGVANYAYHLDAGRFAAFVRDHCVQKLGIRHIVDDVTEVIRSDTGDIDAVQTRKSGRLGGDLFIDASGFRSLLLGETMGVPFVDRSDVLFIDRALAMQVPHDHEQSDIVPYTVSTAQKHGWIWDIGLQSRRGVGYVYSSNHTTADAALAELRAYVGDRHRHVQPREIKIACGHRQVFWKGNCVAVGLAGGFLEPLEASALVLIELSADMISTMLPATRETMPIVAGRYNRTTQYRWDRIIDFLKLHYILSRRTDSAFWIDNRAPTSIPDSLREQMELWRYRAPGDQDFTSNCEMFPAASYQYVLYGMGFRTDTRHQPLDRDIGGAKRAFAQNETLKARWTKTLPKNRDLIDKIKALGLQKI
ncbi:tryptophan halogenase family protein [Steroidobacter agaridevorans]|uniref:tryptophan halogenase family protein n=1 Tax=Steroidobacter agaridevorans TaxID=2695856 RepID=UPI0013228402|nr:tryptophan halogenase family protein [Steroidobacter agaridevorans]GFE85513.1 tryptophan halogenase [Steroidobacter agaridevorans]